MRPGILLIYLSLALVCGSHAFALDDKLSVNSRTLAEEDFLRGNTTVGRPVSVSGNLSGPDGVDKLPVVVLLHGTDGPGSGAVWGWERFLNGIGIATLSLDSYTGRGLTHIRDGVSRRLQPINLCLVNSRKSMMLTGLPMRWRIIRGLTPRGSR
jgi:hypothetical protein